MINQRWTNWTIWSLKDTIIEVHTCHLPNSPLISDWEVHCRDSHWSYVPGLSYSSSLIHFHRRWSMVRSAISHASLQVVVCHSESTSSKWKASTSYPKMNFRTSPYSKSEVASDSSTNSSIYVIPVRNVTYQSHATHTLLPEDLLQYYPTGSLRRGRGKKGYHDKA